MLTFKRFDKFFLVTVFIAFLLPQFFVHYKIDLPVKSASIIIIICTMILRIFLMIEYRSSHFSKEFYTNKGYLVQIIFGILFFAGLRSAFGESQDTKFVLVTIGQLTAFFLIGLNYFQLTKQSLSWSERLYYFSFGFLLFILFNFLLFLIDININFSQDYDEDAGTNLTLALVGFDIKRVLFPLSSGINAYGNVAGIAIIISFYLMRNSKSFNSKIILFVIFTISIASLILVDSRGAYLGLAISFFLASRIRGRGIILIIVIAVFTPLLFYIASQFVTAFGIERFLSRDGTQFGGLVSNRDIIWGISIQKLIVFEPVQLIGYGLFGNSETGVMEKYMWMFAYSESKFMTVHNFSLQAIFDIGYIGFILILYTIYSYINNTNKIFQKNNIYLKNLLNSTVIFILFIGASEAIPTIYFSESFLIFCFFLFSVFANKESESLQYGQLTI